MRRRQHAAMDLDQQRLVAPRFEHELGAYEAVQCERAGYSAHRFAHARRAEELDDGGRTEGGGMRLDATARESCDLRSVPCNARAIDDVPIDEALHDELDRCAGDRISARCRPNGGA
jgi:hypothetical protein